MQTARPILLGDRRYVGRENAKEAAKRLAGIKRSRNGIASIENIWENRAVRSIKMVPEIAANAPSAVTTSAEALEPSGLAFAGSD